MPMSAPLASTSALHEADDGARAGRRGMPNGIGNAEPRRARVDRGLKQPAQRLRVRPRRILGDVHHLQAVAYAKADRLFRAALQVVDRPVFRVDSNRARADEAAALDRQPGLLHDVGDRLNVGENGARGAIGLHAEAAIEDLVGQPLDVASHVRTGARQPDIGGVDADTVEQMEDAKLLLDGRARAPTATAVRREAFRRGAGSGRACGLGASRFQSKIRASSTTCPSARQDPFFNYRGRDRRRVEPQVTDTGLAGHRRTRRAVAPRG